MISYFTNTNFVNLVHSKVILVLLIFLNNFLTSFFNNSYEYNILIELCSFF